MIEPEMCGNGVCVCEESAWRGVVVEGLVCVDIAGECGIADVGVKLTLLVDVGLWRDGRLEAERRSGGVFVGLL